MTIFSMGFPWPTEDPFLFCAHHDDIYPKGNEKQGIDRELLGGRPLGSDFVSKDGFRMYHGKSVPGFPYHPHCGFETITLVTKGFIDHSDSLGAKARFGQGDVQWMTAGSGVQHSEMFPLLNSEGKNELELFQIWLNLPKESKYVNPHFDMIWSQEIPEWEENGVSIRLVFGNWNGKQQLKSPPNSWASNAFNHVVIAQLIVAPKAYFTFEKVADGVVRNLFFYRGNQLNIDDHVLSENQGIRLEANEQCTIVNTGEHPASLILMQGRPIAEPVAKYGPFVMNEAHEIESVIAKYRITEFGGWPWPEAEYTHGPEAIRFATYPDGTTIYAEK